MPTPKNKFSKDILRDRADSLKLDDGILIQLIVQILSINIIIFNFEDEKLLFPINTILDTFDISDSTIS